MNHIEEFLKPLHASVDSCCSTEAFREDLGESFSDREINILLDVEGGRGKMAKITEKYRNPAERGNSGKLNLKSFIFSTSNDLILMVGIMIIPCNDNGSHQTQFS